MQLHELWLLTENPKTIKDFVGFANQNLSFFVLQEIWLRKIFNAETLSFIDFLFVLEEQMKKYPPNWVVIELTNSTDGRMSRSFAQALYTPPSYRDNVVILFQKPLSEKTKKDYENLGINKFFDLQTGGDIMTLLE